MPELESFDRGEMPDTYAEQLRAIARAADGEEVSSPESANPKFLPPPVQVRPVSKGKKAILVYSPETGPGFVLEFHVLDVARTEHSVSLCIESGMSFRPSDLMELELTVEGRTYSVTYAGGAFDFPNLNVRGIAFLLRTKSPTQSLAAGTAANIAPTSKSVSHTN